ncbi:hypothetical protein G6F59_015743 [Rhizopus arrhizus]|nr:hypothetical protein G6F59_015743 [Rhizopus arrhizus]
MQLLEGFFQRVHVQPGALGGQCFAAAVGVEDLLVQVVHAGTRDIAGARGFRTLRGVLFPTLLPAGQPVLGLAQAFLLDLVLFLQLLQLRARPMPGGSRRAPCAGAATARAGAGSAVPGAPACCRPGRPRPARY